MKHLFSHTRSRATDPHRQAADPQICATGQFSRRLRLHIFVAAFVASVVSAVCTPRIAARSVEAADTAFAEVQVDTAIFVKTDDTMTAAMAFLDYPQQDLDLLSQSMRLDMIDYMQQRDSVYKKANIYMGLSWIEKMRPDYMKVHLSDVSSLQIKVFEKGYRGRPLVMAVYTIDDGDGTADSTLSFFDGDMRQIPTKKFIKTPSPTDFYNIPKDSPVSVKDMEQALPFYTIALTIDPDTGDLTGELTAANGLTIEERRRLAPYLHRHLHWHWGGRKFTAPEP